MFNHLKKFNLLKFRASYSFFLLELLLVLIQIELCKKNLGQFIY